MSKTLARSAYSPEALDVLSLLKSKRSSVWDNLNPEEDATERIVRDAIFRATALQKKQIPITPAEKLDAFRIMGFEPSLKQREIAVDDHKVRVVRAGRRSGKALALDTRIPTPDGWTTMGQIQVGDTVFDENGVPCHVTFVSEVFEDHECFEIVFSDGSRVVADADHLWKVETKKVRKGGKWEIDRRHDPNGRRAWRKAHDPPVLTTRAMFAHGVKANKSENEYAIPLAGPIDPPETTTLPVDPYFLGVWLGDGSSQANRIWIDDPDVQIIQECRARGVHIERYEKQPYAWTFYGISATLKRMRLWGNKHIPTSYLRAPVKDRLDLLAGLVDTDGSVGECGDVEITTVYPALAQDMKELAESLGCKVTIREGRATIKGRDCGPKYRVAFTPTLPTAKLARKAAKLKPAHQWQKRYITAINPVPSVPTRCIQVDSESHLYLCANFIPTHNTTLAAHEAVAVMLKKPGSFGWVVAPDYDLAFRCWEIVVAELDKLVARGIVQYKEKSSSKTAMRIALDNGSVCEGQSCENADDLQGVGLDWLVIDEIAQVLPFVFLQMLYPALADRGGWAFLIGTPIGENWTEKEYRHQVRQAQRDQVPCSWSEHMFETWHNTKIFPLGENDPKILDLKRTMPPEEYMEQVCARPQKSRYVTYKEFDEQVHVNKGAKYDPTLPVQISIDPSTGVNPYAVAVFQDRGNLVLMIDEYYKLGVTFDDVIADLATRKWWPNVDEALIDDAWPQERENWRRSPFVHFSVRKAGKSSYVTDGIPIVRNWLRDPLKFNQLVEPIRAKISEESFAGKRFEDLDIEDQNVFLINLEDAASRDKRILADAARFFIAPHCIHVVDEFTGYQYRKRKRDDQNPSEAPTPNKDHLMDAIRYYIHYKKRRYQDDPLRASPRPGSYLDPEPGGRVRTGRAA